MKRLAYLPVDLKTPAVPLESLERYMEALGQKHYTSCWKYAPICGRLPQGESWTDPEAWDRVWLERKKIIDLETRWTEQALEILPEVVGVLKQLPFIQISHCNLLLQIANVPTHFDHDKRYGEQALGQSRDEDLHSYKWLLSEQHLESFYIQSDFRDEASRIYPRISSERGVFLISEEQFPHGARHFQGSRKFILSIFGLLERGAHRLLVEKSLIKYADQAVRY